MLAAALCLDNLLGTSKHRNLTGGDNTILDKLVQVCLHDKTVPSSANFLNADGLVTLLDNSRIEESGDRIIRCRNVAMLLPRAGMLELRLRKMLIKLGRGLGALSGLELLDHFFKFFTELRSRCQFKHTKPHHAMNLWLRLIYNMRIKQFDTFRSVCYEE